MATGEPVGTSEALSQHRDAAVQPATEQSVTEQKGAEEEVAVRKAAEEDAAVGRAATQDAVDDEKAAEVEADEQDRTQMRAKSSAAARPAQPAATAADPPAAVDEQKDAHQPSDVERGNSSSDNDQEKAAHADRPALIRNQSEHLVFPSARADGKRVIAQEECYDELGFCWSWQKRWWIITVTFLVQLSMNFNSSVYANAVTPISELYGVSEQTARVGQMLFLVLYGFGCELWAPWSEEFGRWPILQISLFFVNIWQIPAALAPNLATIFVARALGGISSAGGSVTLAVVADLWEADDHQYALGYVVLSSVAGSTSGAVFGGLIQDNLGLAWIFWIQLILGGITQVIHFFGVPETRATVLMNKIAKRRRLAAEAGTGPKEDLTLYGPDELKVPRVSSKEVVTIWVRPFVMFVREPIVLFLSLLSGFSDALIFTFLEGFNPVFKQWGFTPTQVGLAFIPIEIGYLLGYLSFFPFIHRERVAREKSPESVSPERKLYWLLFTAPLEAIGLFAFAWTSSGPPIPWIVPMIFAAMVGVANYAIYHATIDYTIASYGPYAASATGGNGLARDFLAGIAALYATPLFMNVGAPRNLEYASTILACLACCVTVPIYVFYWKGPEIRARSKFASALESQRREVGGRRVSSVSIEGFGL